MAKRKPKKPGMQSPQYVLDAQRARREQAIAIGCTTQHLERRLEDARRKLADRQATRETLASSYDS